MERLEEIWFNHRSKIIAAFIGLAVLMISGGNLFNERSNKMDESFMANKKVSQTQKQSQVQGKKAVCVDIKGAVAHPGVYRLPGGSRVNEALNAAGRETADADMNQVNLAKQLVDAQVIYIPKKGEKMPGSFGESGVNNLSGDTGGISSEQQITNLNTATKEQLCKITGIGDKKADLILQYRQEHGNFNSVDDLKNINGFGDKTVAKLKPMLAV